MLTSFLYVEPHYSTVYAVLGLLGVVFDLSNKVKTQYMGFFPSKIICFSVIFVLVGLLVWVGIIPGIRLALFYSVGKLPFLWCSLNPSYLARPVIPSRALYGEL